MELSSLWLGGLIKVWARHSISPAETRRQALLRDALRGPAARPRLVRQTRNTRGHHRSARHSTPDGVHTHSSRMRFFVLPSLMSGNGQVVNVKYRALEHKAFRQVKDAEKILYGLDDLTEDWAVIAEGECDKLAPGCGGNPQLSQRAGWCTAGGIKTRCNEVRIPDELCHTARFTQENCSRRRP